MIQIRQNIFETNSSSTHSFVIRTREYENEAIELNDSPYITVELDSYDWGFDVLRSPLQKLSYLLTYTKAVEAVGYESFSRFRDLDGYKILNEAVKQKLGKEIYPVGVNDSDTGIDHQSQLTDTLRELLDSFDVKERKYNWGAVDMAKYIIFNPHVEIWITNDNCEITPYNDDISKEVDQDNRVKLLTGSVKGFTELGHFYIEKE